MDTIEPDDVRWFMDRDGEIVACANTNEVMTVAPADTLLIAAAPDLLAACEAAREAIDDPRSDFQTAIAALDLLNAAIARARGTVTAD